MGARDQYAGVGDFSWVGFITLQQLLGYGEDCGTRRMRGSTWSWWTLSVASGALVFMDWKDGLEECSAWF